MDIQQHSFAIYCILLITYVVVSVRDATEVYARAATVDIVQNDHFLMIIIAQAIYALMQYCPS